MAGARLLDKSGKMLVSSSDGTFTGLGHNMSFKALLDAAGLDLMEVNRQDWIGGDFVAKHPLAPPYRTTGVIMQVKVQYRNMDPMKPQIFAPTADLTVTHFPRVWGAMVCPGHGFPTARVAGAIFLHVF